MAFVNLSLCDNFPCIGEYLSLFFKQKPKYCNCGGTHMFVTFKNYVTNVCCGVAIRGGLNKDKNTHCDMISLFKWRPLLSLYRKKCATFSLNDECVLLHDC